MKAFAERRPPTQARCPAARPEAQGGTPAAAGAHPRGIVQRERIESAIGAPVQRRGDEEERQLKAAGSRSGIAVLSGMAMSDVRVHTGFKAGDRSVETVQRTADPASDPALLAEYNWMLVHSPTFGALDARITGNSRLPVMLFDSSATQDISYDQATHTINVPVSTAAGAAHPLGQVRADILWEMHNALNKGAHARLRARTPGPLPANATREEGLEHRYRIANFALSNEWIEWSRILEAVLRARRMQQELPAAAAGPAAIDDQFGANFAAAGGGWYRFENYLADMIASGHTGFFDADAANPNWKGRRVLNMTANARASLLCTPQEENDFESGKKRNIKMEETNPFRNDTHWKEAIRTDW